jgi:DNA-binding HxlR family transcriptional regulator
MPAREAARKLSECYLGWKEQSENLAICPVRSILNHIADKWSLVVLITLATQPQRFGKLRREIPEISQRMLTQTLSDLQENGLVIRTVFPTKPPSVEYSLSPLGESLMIPLWELVNWAIMHINEIECARDRYNDEDK